MGICGNIKCNLHLVGRERQKEEKDNSANANCNIN